MAEGSGDRKEKKESHYEELFSKKNVSVRKRLYDELKNSEDKDIVEELDEDELEANPRMPKKPKFIGTYTASKDPRNCSVLLFHDTDKFNYVSLLLRKPVLILPIRVEASRDISDFKEWITGIAGDIKMNHSPGAKVLRNMIYGMLSCFMTSIRKARCEARMILFQTGQMVTKRDLVTTEVVWTPQHQEFAFTDALEMTKTAYANDPKIKEEHYEWVISKKKEIKNACMRILADAQTDKHNNGTAKRWACGVFTLVQYLIQLNCTDPSMMQEIDTLTDSMSGDAQGEVLSSCFMHVGAIKDRSVLPKQKGEDEVEVLEAFPPEEYFCQPIAEAAANMVRNGTIDFVPPTHYHAHDYYLCKDDKFAIVVGEAMSGSIYEAEHQKVIPGVMKVLNCFESAMAMTSSHEQCHLTFYKLGYERHQGDIDYPVVEGKRLEFRCTGNERLYPMYIMQIITALEMGVTRWLEMNKNKLAMPSPATASLQKWYREEFKKTTKITVPGVYCGDNIGWVKENGGDLYEMYKKGKRNAISRQAYPYVLNEGEVERPPIPQVTEVFDASEEPTGIMSTARDSGRPTITKLKRESSYGGESNGAKGGTELVAENMEL